MDNSTIQQLGSSLSLTDQNIDQLKALFPQVFCEDKIDFSALKELLGENLLDNKGEYYGLSWVGRNDARKELSKSTTATLTPDKDKSVNFDTTENIFIEGENLEVLRILHKSYFGKIKMIYIDPPYNTGSDSFVYPDDYTETKGEYLKRAGDINEDGYVNRLDAWKVNNKENGQYHSVWLSMMYSRLNYAHNLLADDGVIFVSIDDNEQANLKLLMDSIFGQENFVAQIIWERAFAPVNLKKHFSESHDYIICFAKSIELLSSNGLTRSETDRYKNLDNDIRGDWTSSDMTVGPVIPSKVYEITTPNGKKIFPTSGRCWLFTKDRYEEMLADNRIWFGESGNNTPRVKKFLSEVKEGITPMTIWKHSDVGHSQEAAQKLKALFEGKDYFDYPKSIPLIKRMLQLYCNNNDIVLDFFAGSGTTAQAVMELNAEDGGNRKFICVQMPELTDPKSEAHNEKYFKISDITAERIRRAGRKIQKEQTEKQAGLFDGETKKVDTGLKYFRLTSSHFKVWQGDISKEELEKQLDVFTDATLNESTSEEMLHELILKSGYPLTTQVQIMPQGFYFLPETETKKGCCIALSRFDNEIIEAIETLCPQKTITLDGLFENDAALSNARLRFKDKGISLTII